MRIKRTLGNPLAPTLCLGLSGFHFVFRIRRRQTKRKPERPRERAAADGGRGTGAPDDSLMRIKWAQRPCRGRDDGQWCPDPVRLR
jgi:hypothetical protein